VKPDLGDTVLDLPTPNSQRDERLSWSRWLVVYRLYRDGLHVRRQSARSK